MIVGLSLPQQAGPRYNVVLRLCRAMTSHEIHELIAHPAVGLDVSSDSPAELVATHTTVEEVCSRLPEFHELLAVAAASGQAAHQIATAAAEAQAVEESRRQLLVSDANIGLSGCPHPHDLEDGAT